MSVNKAILVGWLGHDPELRHTTEGTPVCNINIATSETWKDRQGIVQKHTEWHRVVLWKKHAEVAGKFLKKGSQIYIEGKMQTREYEDSKDKSIKHKIYEIVAYDFKMLDKAPKPSDKAGEKKF